MKLFITIPVMDELGYIEKCIGSINSQTYTNFYVIVCVNQPENWRYESSKKHVCENNMKILSYLKELKHPDIIIIDRSSPGNGFTNKEKGVGHARNLLFEKALDMADDDDLIMCLDADTTFEPDYFQSVIDLFSNKSDAIALANPYYHSLTGEEVIDRAILRYEIYMRLYSLNLWRIKSPYAFTPLGSAITVLAKGLRDIGKIAPKLAGEDFYLLQKLRKHGRIIQFNEQYVYPSPRPSTRVPFGTGPAVAEGIKNNWDRYPIFPIEPFEIIKETYQLFPDLYYKNIATPMDDFFKYIFGTKNIFDPLRHNFRDKQKFARACHIKIDGLRIYQFIKYYHHLNKTSDENNFQKQIDLFINKDELYKMNCLKLNFNFENISLPLLQYFRDKLTNKEQEFRKKDYYEPQKPF